MRHVARQQHERARPDSKVPLTTAEAYLPLDDPYCLVYAVMNVQRWAAAHRGARLDQPIVAVGVCTAGFDSNPVTADPERFAVVWPHDEKPVAVSVMHEYLCFLLRFRSV